MGPKSEQVGGIKLKVALKDSDVIWLKLYEIVAFVDKRSDYSERKFNLIKNFDYVFNFDPIQYWKGSFCSLHNFIGNQRYKN